jgi:vesicle transport through interaction with t-SNAREs protein 1
MPQSIKPQYQARIKSAKADLTRFKKLSKELHAQLTRSDLMGGVGGRPIGPSSADDPYGTGDRTRLLAGTALLEDGTKRLQASQRIALETEEQGADILSNLRRQREQIENTRDTVGLDQPVTMLVWWADGISRSYTERMRQSTGLQERSRR